MVCAEGLLGVSVIHSSVPNVYFPGPAKGSNTQWNAAALVLYCAAGEPLFLDQPPISSQYTQQIFPDGGDFDAFEGATNITRATSYNVRWAGIGEQSCLLLLTTAAF